MIYFTVELSAFQNRLLNGTHSIPDIKLPWIIRTFTIFKLSVLGYCFDRSSRPEVFCKKGVLKNTHRGKAP